MSDYDGVTEVDSLLVIHVGCTGCSHAAMTSIQRDVIERFDACLRLVAPNAELDPAPCFEPIGIYGASLPIDEPVKWHSDFGVIRLFDEHVVASSRRRQDHRVQHPLDDFPFDSRRKLFEVFQSWCAMGGVHEVSLAQHSVSASFPPAAGAGLRQFRPS